MVRYITLRCQNNGCNCNAEIISYPNPFSIRRNSITPLLRRMQKLNSNKKKLKINLEIREELETKKKEMMMILSDLEKQSECLEVETDKLVVRRNRILKEKPTSMLGRDIIKGQIHAKLKQQALFLKERSLILEQVRLILKELKELLKQRKIIIEEQEDS